MSQKVWENEDPDKDRTESHPERAEDRRRPVLQ
jgi:hypothetical protein